MSLESALEEERLEILKLLERPRKPSPNSSGAFSTPSSPRQRYTPLHRAASPNRGVQSVSSLLDAVATTPKSPPSTTQRSPSQSPKSAAPPPPATFNGVHRSRSDASSNGPPRLLGAVDRGPTVPLTPHDGYNFSPIPSVAPSKAPVRKRVSQSVLHDPQQAVSPQFGGAFGRRSKSPLSHSNSASFLQQNSPRVSAGELGSPLTPVSPQTSRRTLMSEHGQEIDLDYAYARLNDAALAGSGGLLGTLPERRAIVGGDGEHIRAGSGESLTRDGGVRLQKDLHPNDESAVTSDEDTTDEDSFGSGEHESDEERRGRPGRRQTSSLLKDLDDESRGNSSDREPIPLTNLVGGPADPGGGKKKGKKKAVDATKGTIYTSKKKTMSLLAAAEEERKAVSAKYKVRSLLPAIAVSQPTAPAYPGATSPTTSRRTGVHPSTNFDVPSQNTTPQSSDYEADEIDIRRAQRMALSISPIISTPETQRVVRTIVRGDYEQIVKEEKRRRRKYLVATDLSSEAQYAMEWTLGTVLRDGDTLLAICAVDQETVEDGSKTVTEASIGEAMAEASSQAAAISSLDPPVHPHTPGTSSPLAFDRPDRSRERTKAERERYVAAEAITGLITKLLKKTRLQVKVMIEVIHCKSPKHLLTEIIDHVEPTLVILGSRGRSALKGVLLGSFSNYLVTKSSVPVMVARKKLKHSKKYAKTNVRLANNLTSNTARILANAKVD